MKMPNCEKKNKILLQKLRRQTKRLKIKKQLHGKEILEEASKLLNENALTVLKMQLNHGTKKRKWEDDEKLFALGLYYKLPKA